MRRNALIQLPTICRQLIYGILFCSALNLSAMQHLTPPTEIVISDELGVVERIPMGQAAIDKEMTLWMMKEMAQSNKELQEQLKAMKKKWYVITAGVATTVIPLVICGIELYTATHECD